MGCITSKSSKVALVPTRKEWEELAGKEDTPIAGSRFTRGYCCECGEPIRKQRVWAMIPEGMTCDAMEALGHFVSRSSGMYLVEGGDICNACNPEHQPPAVHYGPYKDDTSPGWENSVRAYEETR